MTGLPITHRRPWRRDPPAPPLPPPRRGPAPRGRPAGGAAHRRASAGRGQQRGRAGSTRRGGRCGGRDGFGWATGAAVRGAAAGRPSVRPFPLSARPGAVAVCVARSFRRSPRVDFGGRCSPRSPARTPRAVTGGSPSHGLHLRRLLLHAVAGSLRRPHLLRHLACEYPGRSAAGGDRYKRLQPWGRRTIFGGMRRAGVVSWGQRGARAGWRCPGARGEAPAAGGPWRERGLPPPAPLPGVCYLLSFYKCRHHWPCCCCSLWKYTRPSVLWEAQPDAAPALSVWRPAGGLALPGSKGSHGSRTDCAKTWDLPGKNSCLSWLRIEPCEGQNHPIADEAVGLFSL